MEIRVGDVVLLRVKVQSVPEHIGLFYGETSPYRHKVAFNGDDVNSVLERKLTETDAEKIARLEARVKELEGFLTVDGPLTKTTNDGKIDGSKPEAPWYPPQLEGYGPWIEGPPPLGWDRKFQVIVEEQRKSKSFDMFSFNWSCRWWQHAVAHCLKLP